MSLVFGPSSGTHCPGIPVPEALQSCITAAYDQGCTEGSGDFLNYVMHQCRTFQSHLTRASTNRPTKTQPQHIKAAFVSLPHEYDDWTLSISNELQIGQFIYVQKIESSHSYKDGFAAAAG
ncbi:Protein of unknown function DUF936, plant [Dillenia turbinata]|uniref:DUF936 domain-containing protein n=1 Tax=Dillenia turbinata TaxID=194707 RepID=A0AAN8Z4L6_9MAGN